MKLHYGDLTDSTNLVRIIALVKPTEIYNLGAQSHVKVSGDEADFLPQSMKSTQYMECSQSIVIIRLFVQTVILSLCTDYFMDHMIILLVVTHGCIKKFKDMIYEMRLRRSRRFNGNVF